MRATWFVAPPTARSRYLVEFSATFLLGAVRVCVCMHPPPQCSAALPATRPPCCRAAPTARPSRRTSTRTWLPWHACITPHRGLSLTFAVYVSASVSGGHVNPAVTLAMCVHKRFEWRYLPGAAHTCMHCPSRTQGMRWRSWPVPFLPAALTTACTTMPSRRTTARCDAHHTTHAHVTGVQNEGAAVGSANNSASIFLPWPQPGLSVAGAFFDQVIGTGLLLFGIFAVLDPRKCVRVLWRPRPTLCAATWGGARSRR